MALAAVRQKPCLSRLPGENLTMALSQTPLPARAAPQHGRLRLQTLVLIRWIALLGQATTLAVVHFGLEYEIPFIPAMAVIAASSPFTLGTNTG